MTRSISTYQDNQDYRELVDIIKSVASSYNYKLEGIEEITGNPTMLHLFSKEGTS